MSLPIFKGKTTQEGTLPKRLINVIPGDGILLDVRFVLTLFSFLNGLVTWLGGVSPLPRAFSQLLLLRVTTKISSGNSFSPTSQHPSPLRPHPLPLPLSLSTAGTLAASTFLPQDLCTAYSLTYKSDRTLTSQWPMASPGSSTPLNLLHFIFYPHHFSLSNILYPFVFVRLVYCCLLSVSLCQNRSSMRMGLFYILFPATLPVSRTASDT